MTYAFNLTLLIFLLFSFSVFLCVSSYLCQCPKQKFFYSIVNTGGAFNVDGSVLFSLMKH